MPFVCDIASKWCIRIISHTIHRVDIVYGIARKIQNLKGENKPKDLIGILVSKTKIISVPHKLRLT